VEKGGSDYVATKSY